MSRDLFLLNILLFITKFRKDLYWYNGVQDDLPSMNKSIFNLLMNLFKSWFLEFLNTYIYIFFKTAFSNS